MFTSNDPKSPLPFLVYANKRRQQQQHSSPRKTLWIALMLVFAACVLGLFSPRMRMGGANLRVRTVSLISSSSHSKSSPIVEEDQAAQENTPVLASLPTSAASPLSRQVKSEEQHAAMRGRVLQQPFADTAPGGNYVDETEAVKIAIPLYGDISNDRFRSKLLSSFKNMKTQLQQEAAASRRM